MGYPVFPLYGKKNHLLPNGCNGASTDPEKIKEWAAKWPDANIGIKCENILVLDLDNKDGKNGSNDLTEIKEELGQFPKSPVVATPTGGFHRYFRHPGVDVKGVAGVKYKGRETGIDIRVGNQYVIAPPSIHPDTGTEYKWVWELVHVNDLPEIPQAWIDNFLPLRDKPVAKEKSVTGSSESVTEAPPTEFPLVINGEAEQKAVEYLKKCPKAIQGRSGHNTLCSIALALVRGFKLEPKRAAEIARVHYNPFCIPAWTDAEIKDFDRKFFEAKKWKTTLPDGWLLSDVETTEKLTWEPFPVDAFPEPLRSYIVESATAINVDPAYVGPFTLAVIASVIGSSARIELKPGWQEPSIIWMGLVASSGSGKSPGLDAAIEPLRIIQHEADKRYEEAESEFEKQMIVYNAKIQLWRGELKKNPNSRPPEKPIPPNAEVYIADDTTSEALVEILSQNPFGVCLPKDELSGWLACFDAYGNGNGKDMAFWLKMHGGRPYRINRKTPPKVLLTSTPAVSICGGIQPGILHKILKENPHYFDSGLAARILFAMPPDQSQRWTDIFVSDEIKRRYRAVIDKIHSWQSGEGAMNPEDPDIITLSESARDVFVAFYDANADEREQMESDAQKAFWPKLTGYAARIALVFHFVKCTENTIDYNTIDGETMEAAIQVVQWFKRESLRIVETMQGETAQVDFEARAIIALIRRKGGGFTAREIRQSVRLFRREGGTERAEKKLNEMVTAGTLVSDSVKGDSGPGTTVYRLPCVNTDEPVDVDNGGVSEPIGIFESDSGNPVYEFPENTGKNDEPVDVDTIDVVENDTPVNNSGSENLPVVYEFPKNSGTCDKPVDMGEIEVCLELPEVVELLPPPVADQDDVSRQRCICKNCQNWDYRTVESSGLCQKVRTQDNPFDCPDYDYDPEPIPF